MNKWTMKMLLGVSLSFLAWPVFATDLMDIYQQALQSDPTLQAASSTRLANREALPQSIAGLLPNLAATANTTHNDLNLTSATGNQNLNQLGTTRFNSGGYAVTLTQPLVNLVNLLQVRSASAVVKQADATYAAATQDFLIRVAKAYFAVLLAQDELHYANAEKAANARQLDQIKQRFNVGIDAITSVYNAQASYDKAAAQEITARNVLNNQVEALRQLTGQMYFDIEGFKVDPPLQLPQPDNVEQWVVGAEKQNLTLLAQRYAVDSARAQVKANFAGHFPTLNAVGAYNRANGQSFGTLNSNSTTAALQVNVPIFAGGLVTSQTRQAKDKYLTASAQLEDIYRQVIVSTRQKYNDVVSGVSQLKADREAIISAQSSLDSTEEAFKVGTRTIVDVLIAQQNLYQAERDYAQDEYTYLLNTLLLKQAAGNLNVTDLQKINVWIHEIPSSRKNARYRRTKTIDATSKS